MKKIRLLDLCCGAGGCAMGYKLAADDLGLEIEIVGIDLVEQKNYPFQFVRDDALSFLIKWGRGFTHIHASFPCQEFSVARRGKNIKKPLHRSIFEAGRQKMYELKLPGVIENVQGSPVVPDIVLEGQMFGLMYLKRKRLFETVNWFMMKVDAYRLQRKDSYKTGKIISVAGHAAKFKGQNAMLVPGDTILEKRKLAMGIDWMTNSEIVQAIPPSYTRYIGNEFFQA
jgi:DNA (cytosine-5)-methyltransferase 1